MVFDGLIYTRKGMIKQLLKIEEHSTDNSAYEEGCKCVQERHLLSFEGFAEEGQVIATDEKEKGFDRECTKWAQQSYETVLETLKKSDLEQKKLYTCLADEAREIRLRIEDESWIFPKEPSGCQLCLTCDPPDGRHYLPHGLTEAEKKSASTRKKLSSCISEVEISCCGEHTTDYSGCTCNPVAVCRASIEH